MRSKAEGIKELLISLNGTGAMLREIVGSVGCSSSNAATLLKRWHDLGCVGIQGENGSRRYVWTGKAFPGARGGKTGLVHHTDSKGLLADLTFQVLQEAGKSLTLNQIASRVRSLYLSSTSNKGRRKMDSTSEFRSIVRTQLSRWCRDGYVIQKCSREEELFQLAPGVKERPPVRAIARS